MRSSTVIALLGGASLAAASPIGNLFKKAIVYDIEIETVYITVTEGQVPATQADDGTTTVVVQSTVVVNPVAAPTPEVVVPTTSASPPPPPPAPTAIAPAPVVMAQVQTTQAPAPAPVVEAPAPVVQQPAPAAPAPVVQPAVAEAVSAAPSDFISSGLFYHNKHRENHGASALTWDANLASYAQTVANRCKFAHDSTVGGGGYGQNIDSAGMVAADGWSSAEIAKLDADTKAWNKAHVLASAISNDWYKPEEPTYESVYHAYGKAQPAAENGVNQYLHFTQIVWKDTTKVGCAVAYCGTSLFAGSYNWFTVCNYASPGNFAGEYAKNVAKPTFKVTVNAPSASS